MADRIAKAVIWVLGPVLCLVIVIFTSQDVRSAYSARFGEGTPGTFVARHESCRKTCFWTGDFYSADGVLRRTNVGLGAGHSPSAVGDRVSAVDTGDRVDVYPRGGGWDWLLITGLLGVGVGGLCWYIRQAWCRFLGHQARPQ